MARKRKQDRARETGCVLANVDYGSAVKFRLLDPKFPDELRLRVLKFAVVRSSPEKPIDIRAAVTIQKLPWQHGFVPRKPAKRQTYNRTPHYRREATPLLQPAITRSCRLFRIEGLKIFYQQNYFSLRLQYEDLMSLLKWARDIQSRRIQHLYLCWTTVVSNTPIRNQFLVKMSAWFFYTGPVGIDSCLKVKDGKVVFRKVGGRDWCMNIDLWGHQNPAEWMRIRNMTLAGLGGSNDFWVTE